MLCVIKQHFLWVYSFAGWLIYGGWYMMHLQRSTFSSPFVFDASLKAEKRDSNSLWLSLLKLMNEWNEKEKGLRLKWSLNLIMMRNKRRFNDRLWRFFKGKVDYCINCHHSLINGRWTSSCIITARRPRSWVCIKNKVASRRHFLALPHFWVDFFAAPIFNRSNGIDDGNRRRSLWLIITGREKESEQVMGLTSKHAITLYATPNHANYLLSVSQKGKSRASFWQDAVS